MNPATQPDIHPDAESLNAFVEQALTERERGQILAHLAACGRCRQVVTLAQEMAAGMDSAPLAHVQAAQPTRRPASWFWNWRFAWVPAAALAVIVALAVFVQVRHGESGQEMAKATAPSAPGIEASVPAASSPERAVASTVKPPASPIPAKSLARDHKAARPEVEAESSPAEIAAAERAQSRAETIGSLSAEREGPALGAGAPERGVASQDALAQYKPKISAASREQQLQSFVGASSGAVKAVKPNRAEAVDMVSGAQADARFSGTSAAPQGKTQSALLRSLKAAQQMQANESVGSLKAKMIGLPSGLAAVSAASAKHCTLALDPAGTLFLREDSGNHWEQVSRQWTGRAVKVRAQQAPSGVIPTATAPPPVGVFEIVNDSGQVWVSQDGRTWKRK